jgi:hypothetical protein
MGTYKTCRFCNINGHLEDDCQLFINLLMASRVANQNSDLVSSTLKKHSTFMRSKPRGRAPHTNNRGTVVSSDVVDGVTLDGGQVVQFDNDGIVCHLQEESAIYYYEASEDESTHSDPCVAPVIHMTDMDTNYVPNLDDCLVAHVGEEKDYLFTYEDMVTANN